jgi:cation transport ATPase
MADENTPSTEGTTPQTAPMEPSGPEPKTFTQEQVNRMMQERVARVKSEPPADYEELKAKAARLDEIEEANKSELEKANDARAKAETEAADWKAKYEQAQAEHQRMATVTQMAAVILLMLCVPLQGEPLLGQPGVVLAQSAMYLAAAMTVISGADYIVRNFDCIRDM